MIGEPAAARRAPWLVRAVAPVISAPPVTWLFLRVFPHVDRVLLRLSRGWLSVAIGQPVVLLESTGARTGLVRKTPLVCAPDGDRIILIASNGGRPDHPAWYYNLKKHPRAAGTLRGRKRTFRAREVHGADREAMWKKALAVYPGFTTYQKRAGARQIPVFLLEPEE